MQFVDEYACALFYRGCDGYETPELAASKQGGTSEASLVCAVGFVGYYYHPEYLLE